VSSASTATSISSGISLCLTNERRASSQARDSTQSKRKEIRTKKNRENCSEAGANNHHIATIGSNTTSASVQSHNVRTQRRLHRSRAREAPQTTHGGELDSEHTLRARFWTSTIRTSLFYVKTCHDPWYWGLSNAVELNKRPRHNKRILKRKSNKRKVYPQIFIEYAQTQIDHNTQDVGRL